MIATLSITFLVGGLFGMIGMGIMAYGSKMNLIQENRILHKRLEFLEKTGGLTRYQPVKDPRPNVHSLVN